jgi:hypothetical protein
MGHPVLGLAIHWACLGEIRFIKDFTGPGFTLSQASYKNPNPIKT